MAKPYFNTDVEEAVKRSTGFSIAESVRKQEQLFNVGVTFAVLAFIAFVMPLFIPAVLEKDLSRAALFVSVAISGGLGIVTGVCGIKYVNEGLKKTEAVAASTAISAVKISENVEKDAPKKEQVEVEVVEKISKPVESEVSVEAKKIVESASQKSPSAKVKKKVKSDVSEKVLDDFSKEMSLLQTKMERSPVDKIRITSGDGVAVQA